MEYKVDPEHLKENGGQKLCILALDGAGRVLYIYICIYILCNSIVVFSVDSFKQHVATLVLISNDFVSLF